jgi:hypothetical protein
MGKYWQPKPPFRPVKDVLYLAPAMSTWHKRDRTIRFLIVGDAIDPEYSAVVRDTVAALEGVFLVPAVAQRQFWGLLYVPAIWTFSSCLSSLTFFFCFFGRAFNKKSKKILSVR